jgi:hypothetical protein
MLEDVGSFRIEFECGQVRFRHMSGDRFTEKIKMDMSLLHLFYIDKIVFQAMIVDEI